MSVYIERRKKKKVQLVVAKQEEPVEEKISEESETSVSEKAEVSVVVDKTAKKQEKPKKTKKNQKKKEAVNGEKTKKKKEVEKTEFQTEDELLEREISAKKEGLCHFADCAEKLTLIHLHMVCRHCKCAYCHAHSLAEVHGCAEKAKIAARQEWLMKSAQGQSMTAAKKQVLKNVLKTKLKEKAAARAPQKKKQ